MANIKAVVFDIDGTLTEQNSWSVTALAMGGTSEEDLEIYEIYKMGEIRQEEADGRLLEMWKRKGLASRENFKKTFASIKLRSDALDLISYLKSKGIIICLITGSMDLYAKIISDRVQADDYYSNAQLFFDEQGKIADFNYVVNQGGLKLEQFKNFLKKYNLKSVDCAAIGDSENDYLLFLETKKGIAVRTKFEDKVLEAAAWQVVDNLSEIKNIIK